MVKPSRASFGIPTPAFLVAATLLINHLGGIIFNRQILSEFCFGLNLDIKIKVLILKLPKLDVYVPNKMHA
jgi:hypothetical protein